MNCMRQWEFLKKSFQMGRLSHGYIFSGNDSVGKKETALNLAQWINCEQRIRMEEPCSVCRICKAIEEQRFPDVTFIEPLASIESTEGKEIKISQIRDLRGHMSLGAWVSSYKTAIIEKADTMNPEAQSAFLKLLEEPKGNSLFLLLTDRAEMLFETIRSRTQEIKFYNFKQEKEVSSQISKNFERLGAASLQERFAFAKKLSESPEQLKITLECWLWHARRLLLEHIKQNSSQVPSLLRVVQTIQDISVVLANTNVNIRGALERIMLEL